MNRTAWESALRSLDTQHVKEIGGPVRRHGKSNAQERLLVFGMLSGSGVRKLGSLLPYYIACAALKNRERIVVRGVVAEFD